MKVGLTAIVCVIILGCALCGDTAYGQQREANVYAQWENGLPKDPNFFPITVWLQGPGNAARYKAAGINIYVALWNGPTEEQLATLKAAGMQVICSQNEVGLQHLNDKTIVAWMHGDEPDNAQSMEGTWKNDADAANKAWPDVGDRTLEQWGTYGPPIPPQRIVTSYERIKARDPSRPVMLNLGQGVANDNYVGRGVRSGRLEDYPEYMKGCDIVSFDIYPVVHSKSHVKGNLWYVPKGVDRLIGWSEGRKIVWNVIECTHIYSEVKPTPHQVKVEAWMSLIHGSKGLIYFVHEWYPKFNEQALLDDPEMLAGVTAINRQIHQLAPVLNSPTIPDGAQVTTSNAAVPVDVMVKQHQGATYLFAVSMRDGQTRASFAVKGLPAAATAEVLGESRTINVTNGKLQDDFKGYDVHLYRIQ